MTVAHVHLLLNHFPTVGFSIGLGLLIISLWTKTEELKRASLVVIFGIALLTIPTYITGNGAQNELQTDTTLSQSLIRAHESAAFLGYVFMELTGFIAWLGLWQYRRPSPLRRWTIPSVLILSIITFALMANAAYIGGEIHHPEILSPEDKAAVESTTSLELARVVGGFVTNHSWVWPTCETLHFVGLSLLFTVVFMVDLRMLGVAKKISFRALYQLLPFGMLGFGLNLATGMMFFTATPEQYTKNVAFYWKMLFVVLAGINVLYFMLFDAPWDVGPGDEAPLTAKIMAASAIFLWIGVLYFGHMLPFIGNSF